MSLNTRQQIIHYIQDHGHTTAVELSHVFHVTPAAIRYHIAILLRDGELEVVPDHNADQARGHPARRLRISSHSKPHNLGQLSHTLLRLLIARNNGTISEQLAAEIASLMVSNFQTTSTKRSQRFSEIIAYLTSHHYQPDWEARAHGPRIRFHNCPYSILLNEFPDLCKIDQSVLRILTGGSVVHITTFDNRRPGKCCCIFDITPGIPASQQVSDIPAPNQT